MDADDPRRLDIVSAAAARLQADYAAGVAIQALGERGIPSLLLKGASITRWVFEPEDKRTYGDCDLLVPPGDFTAAVAELQRLGYESVLDEAQMPFWWREHALAMLNRQRGAVVDLHRSLPGVNVDGAQLWATLSRGTELLVVGGVEANMLSPAGRALQAALHAAQHGGTKRDLDVLSRVIDRIDIATWHAAARLADELQAGAAFQRGLSLLPPGEAVVRTLKLDARPTVDVELRAARAPEALTLARLMQTKKLSERLSLIRHKLFPPPTFMRKWSPHARRGHLGLAIAYLWRPIWVLRRFPRALRAVALARRAGRS